MSKKNEKCIVKFENDNRKITLYFSQNGDGLDMNMEVWPEFDPEKEEEPDLALLLCSTLVNVLNTDVESKEDDLNKVYDGNN